MYLSICWKSFLNLMWHFWFTFLSNRANWWCVKTSWLELKLDISIFYFILRQNKWPPESVESGFGNARFCLLEEQPWCLETFKSHRSKVAVTVRLKRLQISSLKTWCHTCVWQWQTHYLVSLCFALKQKRLAGPYPQKHEWKKRLVAQGALYEIPRHQRLWGEPRAFGNKSISDANPLSR